MANVTAPQFQQDVNKASEWANGDENTTVTMRLGQTARSPAKVIKDIENQANSAILAAANNFNLSPSGFDFSTGGTLTSNNQTVTDASGNEWIYTLEIPEGGYTVTAGTTPTDPPYKQVTYTDHNNASNRNAVGAHDDIYIRTTTLAEAVSEDAPEGTRYSIDGGTFVVVGSSDTQGIYKGVLASGRKLKLDFSQRTEQDNVTESLTVGESNAMFNTLNEAITFCALVNANKDSQITVLLKSNFVMKEQLLLDSIDLGFVTIKSEDPTVFIDGDFINQEFPAGTNRMPVIAGINGSVLPTIDTLFALDQSKSLNNIYGIRTFESRVKINATKGFSGFSGVNGRCAEFSRSSNISAAGSFFSGASGASGVCVRVSNASYADMRDSEIKDSTFNLDVGGGCSVNAQNANLTGSILRGVSVTGPAIVQIPNSNVSGGLGDGIRATSSGCIIHADGVDASNCNVGINAAENATINARSANLDACNTGIISKSLSKVTARGSSCVASQGGVSVSVDGGYVDLDTDELTATNSNYSNANGHVIIVSNGGEVRAKGMIATNAGDIAVECYPSGRLYAQQADFSGSGGAAGITAREGSFIMFKDGNAQSGASPFQTDIQCLSGSTIVAHGATGGLSKTANTIDADGVIYQ